MHRRRTRAAAVAAITVLALGGIATGSAVDLTSGSEPTTAAAAPVAAADRAEESTALGPCRMPNPMGVQMSEGLPTSPGYTRSTGRVRALTLMIDFPDAPGDGSAMSRFGEFFPQTSNWYRTSSYGRLDYRPETPIPGWLRMPHPFSSYGIERGAPYDPGYRDLAEDIVTAADPRVDFSQYDLINVIATPNAGPSALDTVLSVTFSGNDEAPVADGVSLANMSFVYSRQDDGSGSFGATGYRVLPHENGHTFGLPDLYTNEGGGSVGHWDIMSEDWGANNDMLGWHKWKLGWLQPAQIRCASRPGIRDVTLTPLAVPGGTKLAIVPLAGESGYVAEVRTRAGNDEAVCKPGVLIYKVDTDVDTGHGPVTVADSSRDSGGCTRRANVQAELSDAPYGVGETFKDRANDIRITVTGRDWAGNYRVRISRS
ncbi:M6 family metalloprotease domain-containing protein [Streptomyces sp. NBC_01465]|uniref:M6 family metalloprotease domain-containing protein n=1 Tax=Streptomyces sp. NBC_01465 TaxID=2903878 RepID=UPI002E31AD14|nr:M6 family metalloprotease domain-containing protein [Streptomyces sp. NBC_01465]